MCVGVTRSLIHIIGVVRRIFQAENVFWLMRLLSAEELPNEGMCLIENRFRCRPTYCCSVCHRIVLIA